MKFLLALATTAFLLTLVAFASAVTAVNDSFTVYQNSASNNLHVKANDGNDPVTRSALISVETDPQQGTYSINQIAGSVIYTPTPGYSGPDSFTYKLTAGLEVSNIATVTINVRTNLAPIANDDFFETEEDTPTGTRNVLANDTDPDGDLMLVQAVSSPAHGSISTWTTDGNFNYIPEADYQGSDSFTYTVWDGNLQSTGTVHLSIVPPNQAPVAGDDGPIVEANSAGNVFIVLVNDSDPESDPISVVAVGSAAHGTTSFTAGNVTYTPNAGYSGPDPFTYTISDGDLQDTATVFVRVNPPAPVNNPPVANDDSATVAEDSGATAIPVLANDSDPNGNPISVTGVGAASKGTASLSAGVVSYQPNANANGSDSFSYTISDGALTATATVSITITPVNDTPIAVNDSASTNTNTAVSIPVLNNDSDPDGDTLVIQAFYTSTVAGGRITRSGNNLIYTPKRNFTGSDLFKYDINDGKGAVATATVTVNVSAPPKPPTNDAFSNAIAINTSTSANYSGSNVLATKEANEPNHATGLGKTSSGNSVWWTWKSPNNNGSVTITTVGSSFDTCLAVYIKAGQPIKVSTVVLKVNNDNSGGTLQSAVTFVVAPNTIYYIAVDGVVGSSPTTGSVAGNLTFTPTGAG